MRVPSNSRKRLRRRAASLASLGALVLAGCNFQVPASTYLSETKLIAVTVEVVELGPLNPTRVGPETGAPIAEPMPYDRVAFEAVVVDVDGNRLPADELETIWFQCSVFDCASGFITPEQSLLDYRCEAFAEGTATLTTDAVCRLGEGDGRFEFEVPEIGQVLLNQRVALYYGVVAWGGQRAEDCWKARRSLDRSLDNCAYISRSVRFGPTWWMLAYGESIGLLSPLPLYFIPIGVFVQAANRVPLPTFDVIVDGETVGQWPTKQQFEARPNSRIQILVSYDEVTQFFQTYFAYSARDGGADFLFTAMPELMLESPFTSNAIHAVDREEFLLKPGGAPPLAYEFFVDEYAATGTSRIWMVYFDDRFAEGVASFEFEVKD